ncbi:EcoAI/FtnUII family type I restriction enzme subunit R [Burkholderia pseudomallei]|uniref:EcoAI/FtnUII family type I restriction enzme subunit R n=1 Tax=Burkholderia pseudomallei TaxID=28450 RepID=UPI00168AD830|nr:DEAD/DEAH box helicase family protein [Burkholderia pseudomallei]MBD2959074.1 DEAD/DEAH box helicase family protein [Burkholderia pseudomallei]MBD2977638.1 DEAD/DEAH box helicase family protein [Burkholderia pseudomallei]MBF3696483.1 DEAD/DEAH box helicase family protein [Burkholderia pseudomallei]
MDKKSLSEQDIRSKFISPALIEAGWDLQLQIREEVALTDGRVIVRGNRARRDEKTIRRADYVLYLKPGIPLAVVEAKDNNHSVRDGIQQALAYADMLDVPFAFSSNGDGFLWHDRTIHDGVLEREIEINEFPSPGVLWQRYLAWKGIAPEAAPIYSQDYHPGKTARYYQLNAVNRAIEAVTKGQQRILLVMATGTGKTFTAFQIIWRLWRARAVKRILFLADRNILVDQTKVNDFKPFGGAMTKIENRTIDKSYEIYLSLYQAVTGTEQEQNVYREFSPDFFDLVVIDECHRGSAAEDSAWREILDYFSSATHLGLTATPKETAEISNITYFGEPVYTYSLRQGIEDGFLAPYKVIRVDLDKDLGWRPTLGMVDKSGQIIEDRIYNQSDMNKSLVLTRRDEAVAWRITEFLKATDRMAKTIVFCEDIDHAARMRQALANANADLATSNPKYVMQITGDNAEGKLELDNFINPRKTYPVIATTSRLMTTGVDAKTCRLVVLDRTINSMTEFKQIIGRGTRIDEEHGKLWFTILDFKKATELFADPAFDGDPVVVFEPEPDAPITPPEDESESPGIDGQAGDPLPSGGDERVRYVVDEVPVYVVNERVQYLGPDGKLIIESLRDFTRIQIGKRFVSLDAFLQAWSEADRKRVIIEELEEHGVLFDELAREVGKELDPFDLICHIAFGQKPLTRRERAERVKKRDVFGKYSDTARKVLQALLDKYADAGIENIEQPEVLKLTPLDQLGSPVEIIGAFGGRAQYQAALRELERALYQ